MTKQRNLEVQTPGAAPKENTDGTKELRTDGPTVADYVAAGYRAENYPPEGYASRSTDEEIKAAIAGQTVGGVASTAGPTMEELQAQVAALQADNERLAAENAAKKVATDPEANRKAAAAADAAFENAGRSITRASREQYLSMPASKVDPKTLVSAVLTKDGWVAPDQTGQKGKE